MRLYEITKDTFYHSLKYGNYAPIMKKLDELKHELAPDGLELTYQYHKEDKTFEVAVRMPYKTHTRDSNHLILSINRAVLRSFSDDRYDLKFSNPLIDRMLGDHPDTFHRLEVK